MRSGRMLRSVLSLLAVGILFYNDCHAVPDLPLLTYDRTNNRYVPISEEQWNSRIKKNFVFPELEGEELLEVNNIYREMRVEYLYGEFRGPDSIELSEFLEYLVDKSTPHSTPIASDDEK